jgi:antirestriction protein ArdC
MTEKTTQEKQAAERQVQLLTEALEQAKANGGLWLNEARKPAPRLYPKGPEVSPFNALTWALASDANGYRTNLFTTFAEAKRQQMAVQADEKGVPYNWYVWDHYVNRHNAEDVIGKEAYRKLDPGQQELYKGVRKRQVLTVFNLDQTTLPLVDKERYALELAHHGGAADRGELEKEEANLRQTVNRFLEQSKKNLVSIRREASGIAHYDIGKDAVYLPAQKHFASYEEYVQEAVRQISSATGHLQRLAREGADRQSGKEPSEDMHKQELLVNELAAGVKLMELALPARLAPENLELVDDWVRGLKENPCMIDVVESEVNRSLSMIHQAERGEKVVAASKQTSQETEHLRQQAPLPYEAVDFDKILMLQDDANQWTLFLKPENGAALAIHPDKTDLNRFFTTLKEGKTEDTDRQRKEMAQKYYALAQSYPELKVDLFQSAVQDVDGTRIERVNIYKTKPTDENPKGCINCVVKIKDVEKVEPREVSPSQWQRMWLAEDREAYKKQLAMTLFADVLKKDVSVSEKKEVSEKEEKKDLSQLERYKELRAKHPDAIFLFRTGDFYVSYNEDAVKASDHLGITLTKYNPDSEMAKAGFTQCAAFPYHSLDTYLPKLIRAGERVAICDQLEEARQVRQTQQQEAEASEETSRRMHR